MESKYKGVDLRQIKCCSDSPSSIEAGISIEQDDDGTYLFFHYLYYVGGLNDEKKILSQNTKAMLLNEENTLALIAKLKELKFKKK